MKILKDNLGYKVTEKLRDLTQIHTIIIHNITGKHDIDCELTIHINSENTQFAWYMDGDIWNTAVVNLNGSQSTADQLESFILTFG